MSSTAEAKEWIEQFREIAHKAVEHAQRVRRRLSHAEADGDEVLATCLREQLASAELAAQDIHAACDQLDKKLP